MNTKRIETLVIEGVSYVPADSLPKPPTGTRCVIVVDRGWVFAGDVTEANGRIKLDRAVHIWRYSEIGFDGMVANPNSPKVVIKPMAYPVDMPVDAEIFRVPVPDSWGLQ